MYDGDAHSANGREDTAHVYDLVEAKWQSAVAQPFRSFLTATAISGQAASATDPAPAASHKMVRRHVSAVHQVYSGKRDATL